MIIIHTNTSYYNCVTYAFTDSDFGVLKIDMQKAFNLVSCQVIQNECFTNFCLG